MIDFRHKTFLIVCRLKSLTKAAEALYITQPAVSQHIQYLEDEYGFSLITFNKRKFEITDKGLVLYNYLSTLEVDSQKLCSRLQKKENSATHLSFGATLSIGEYVMPSIIRSLINKNPDMHLSMLVDNTKVLLQKLENGEIGFALIEGSFNKDRYDSKVFSLEPFTAICSPSIVNEISNSFMSLFKYRLFTREKGSGTRMILEQILLENSFTIDQFSKLIEIGNISAIKDLVMSGLGIAFLYKATVKKELEAGTLCEITINNFSHMREFSFVYLKNSYFAHEYLEYFEILKNIN